MRCPGDGKLGLSAFVTSSDDPPRLARSRPRGVPRKSARRVACSPQQLATDCEEMHLSSCVKGLSVPRRVLLTRRFRDESSGGHALLGAEPKSVQGRRELPSAT